MFIIELVAVHPGRPTYQPISRRALDELLDTPSTALGGNGEPAVLGEAARVAQVVNVLPRRTTTVEVATSGHLGPSDIGQKPSSSEQFGQVASDVVDVEFVHHDNGASIVGTGLDHGQLVAVGYQTPDHDIHGHELA